MTEKETYIRIANKVLQGKLSLQDVRKVLGTKYEDWYKECYSRMYNIRISAIELDKIEQLNNLMKEKQQIVFKYRQLLINFRKYMLELNDWVKQNIPVKHDITKAEQAAIDSLKPGIPADRSRPAYRVIRTTTTKKDGELVITTRAREAVFRTVSSNTEEVASNVYRNTATNDYVVIRPEEMQAFRLKNIELRQKHDASQTYFNLIKNKPDYSAAKIELRKAADEKYNIIKEQIEKVEVNRDGLLLLALLGIL